MLLTGASTLSVAAAEQRAVPAFVAYNLETAQAIALAAERTGLPVLMIAGSSAFRHAGLAALARLCLDVAGSADAQIGVHLDHSRSIEEVQTCIDLGYTSVMIDGSHLPFEQNVALTREVVARAHAAGVWVEAELVGTAGDEDLSTNATAGAMTDPLEAQAFVGATEIDALAVSVGNVHGFTAVEPQIDLGRLEQIRSVVPIPLVLHGASGLATATLRACVERGVAKVNVNTELRRAFLQGFAEALPNALETVDLAGPLAAAREAVTRSAATITLALAAPAPREVS